MLYCGTEFNVSRALAGDYPQIIYTMYLRRKPLYYVVNLIIPCFLLSFMALFTFLLQPNCADRLGLSTFVIFFYFHSSPCIELMAAVPPVNRRRQLRPRPMFYNIFYFYFNKCIAKQYCCCCSILPNGRFPSSLTPS